ncbi:MAG: hypothetical protein ACPKPY_06175 [Nitrososphaeraceae archaeon]
MDYIVNLFIIVHIIVNLNISTKSIFQISIKYYCGLEHLIFLNAIRERYRIGIVSSLPHYYIKSKFNFDVHNNGKEVVNTILTRNGKNSKITIGTNPDIMLFKNE